MSGSELKAAVVAADKPALEQLIDGLFAGLEARTTNQIVLFGLKTANDIIDKLLAAYGL